MNEAATQPLDATPDVTAVDARQRPLPANGAIKTVGLICNPNSGRNRKHLSRIEQIIAGAPNIHYSPTATEHDIPTALSHFAQANIDVLAINGGDGTVAHVLTHLLRDERFETLPALVLLPGGTTNMNVGDVGVSGRILLTVDKLVRWSKGQLDTREVVVRPILQATPGTDAEPIFGMIFGTGAIIQAIEYWHQSVKRSGFRDEFSSGLAMLRTVWGLLRGDPRFSQPVHLDMTFENGDRLQEDTMLMAVSCMQRVFLNFRPFWGKENGALHMTTIRHGAQRFLRTLPRVMLGRPHRLLTAEAGYRSHNIDQLSILMSGAFTMDGDIYHVDRSAGPVVIRHFCNMPFIRF